jgi:microcystin-dependent protein
MNRQLIGQVNVFAFDFVPADWVACNGQLLSIQKFSELFSLIGTNFGGDGTSSFGVPDFPNLTEQGGKYCMAVVGNAPTDPSQAFIGELALLPYVPPFVPPHPSIWINCDGQTLSIEQSPSLFKFLGTTFGGDGKTTFGIPDLTQAPPVLPSQGSNPPLPQSIYSIANVPSGGVAQGLVGGVMSFPSPDPPKGWSLCNGQLLPIANNPQLANLLQTTYGGDGTSNFGLPDFTSLQPPGVYYYICTRGLYPQQYQQPSQ